MMTMKHEPRNNMYEYAKENQSAQRLNNRLPAAILNSPPSDHPSAVGLSAHNLRVSTGGTSKMETIKAFVQANKHMSTMQYHEEL